MLVKKYSWQNYQVFSFLNEIFSFQVFTDIKVIPTFDLDYQRNSYAYDYFKNTNRRTLEEENHIRLHEQYTLLSDFLLALKVSKEIRYLI